MIRDLLCGLLELVLTAIIIVGLVFPRLATRNRSIVVIDDSVPRRLPDWMLHDIRSSDAWMWAGSGIGVVWGAFAIKWLTGFDILDRVGHEQPPVPILHYLAFVLAFTAVCLVGWWWSTRTSLRLARHGTPVDAELISHAENLVEGTRLVTFSYQLSGRTFSNTAALAFDALQVALDRGSLLILVDPRRPRISQPLRKIHELLRHVGETPISDTPQRNSSSSASQA